MLKYVSLRYGLATAAVTSAVRDVRGILAPPQSFAGGNTNASETIGTTFAGASRTKAQRDATENKNDAVQRNISTASTAPVHGNYSTSEMIAGLIPWRLFGQVGVPVKKHSLLKHKRKFGSGMYRRRFLRLKNWYYCPLCSEPKEPFRYCRRDDCRTMKP